MLKLQRKSFFDKIISGGLSLAGHLVKKNNFLSKFLILKLI